MPGSPTRTAWKYAWGDRATESVRGPAACSGAAVSERLYRAACTGRAAREEAQRAAAASAGSSPADQRAARTKKGARLAASRVDQLKSTTRSGRAQAQEVTPVSANYGAMLYEEAKREQEKRELWRQRQLALRAEADVECTFQPQLGPSVKQFGAGEDEDFAERFERMQAERCAKRLELEKEVRAEEERECTFRPVAKNKNSERITAGYGDCLDEMRARERMREERIAALRSQVEQEVLSGISSKPDTSKPRVPGTAAVESSQASEPAYVRLYAQRTASQQIGDSAVQLDPNCTFRPNMSGTGEAWELSTSRPKAHLEEVGDALYKDAHNRRLRRQMMQEQLSSELHELRNGPKVSRNSHKLALKRLGRDVLDIYAALQAEERGLGYQEFGAALVELGLLRGASSAPPKGVGVVASQAKEDALMLQRLWRHLTTAEPTAALHSDTLMAFIAKALKPDEPEQPASSEMVLPEPQEAWAQGYDDPEPPPASPRAASDEEGSGLLRDFAALYRNTLSYKSTRNVREATESALVKEDANCTYKPAINPKSRRLEGWRQQSADSSVGAAQPRHLQLYERARERDDKLELERMRAAVAELEACTFNPSVQKSSRHAGANEGAAEMGERRFEYLHAHAMEAKAPSALPTEEREIAKCTFQPQLQAKYKPAAMHKPPSGYVAAVERMRKSLEDKEARELEDAAAAARRAAAAKGPPKPFSFQTDVRRGERKTPLLYMDVNLGPGRTGRIGLHHGDDPEQLASNFARTYQLDATMRGRLQALIEKYMAEVLPDLAAQQEETRPSSPRATSSPTRLTPRTAGRAVADGAVSSK